MSPRTYFRLSGTIFSVIFLLHFARMLYSWQAEIAGWTIPMWLSFVAVIIGALMANTAFRLMMKK